MVLFGTKEITTIIKQGDFYCPSCQHESTYYHQNITEYFCFFIPLIRKGVEGSILCCDNCDTIYIPAHLREDGTVIKDKYLTPFQELLHYGFALFLLISAMPKKRANYLNDNYFDGHGFNINIEYVFGLSSFVQQHYQDVLMYLKKSLPQSNKEERDIFAKMMFSIGFQDGNLSREETRVATILSKVLK